MPIEIPKLAGKPYRPSNGTEGEMFMQMHCRYCRHNGPCIIQSLSMAYDLGDEGYPVELVFNVNGRPTCTGFEVHFEEGE